VYAKNFLTFGYGPHYCVGECSLSPGHRPRRQPACGNVAEMRKELGAMLCSAAVSEFTPGRAQNCTANGRAANFKRQPALLLTLLLPPLSAMLPAGKEYAINQLVLFLSIVSLECEWERKRTPQSGELRQFRAACSCAVPLLLPVPCRPPCGGWHCSFALALASTSLDLFPISGQLQRLSFTTPPAQTTSSTCPPSTPAMPCCRCGPARRELRLAHRRPRLPTPLARLAGSSCSPDRPCA